MKLLLTSGGLTNKSITDALKRLIGKPFALAKVVFIPTAAGAEQGDKTWLAKDFSLICNLGWQRFSVVDLAAVAGLPRAGWWGEIQGADVIVVGGGNTFFLSYWLQKSGLMALLPQLLQQKVYVGISAGSIVVGSGMYVSQSAALVEYAEEAPKGESSLETACLVGFVVRPHLDSPDFPNMRHAALKNIAAELAMPTYAIDDQTAIQVIADEITVVSEGKWRLYEPKK